MCFCYARGFLINVIFIVNSCFFMFLCYLKKKKRNLYLVIEFCALNCTILYENKTVYICTYLDDPKDSNTYYYNL